MAGTLRSPLEALPSGPVDPRLRSTWRLLTGSFALLGLAGAILVATDPGRPLGLVVLGLVVAAGVAAGVHQQLTARLESARRLEAEQVARLLQGLSRSASPDAIVETLLADLGAGTGADHVVVVRHRPRDRTLVAILGGPRPGDPSSTVVLAAAGLEAPAVDHRPLEARLEARIATELGLTNTLAAALRSERVISGAIVLARRGGTPWPASARRILQAAANEASAALDRVESHRRAEARASTDVLTGLPNRRYFEEFCALLGGRRRVDDAIGILMVDIDHFKRVNDRFGHDAGDDVLRAVGGAIAGAVREGDVPARFGGEEFAILLRNPSGRVAIDVAERIRSAVAALELPTPGPTDVRVSVGAAVQLGPDEPVAGLLARADRALYRAKRAGRDRVEAA